jgi:hypothetical protein
LRKEKIDSVFGLLDVNGVPVSIVFEDKLLEEEKCPFMENILSYLDTCPPGVCRVRLCTIRTLLIGYDISDLETLLQDDTV